MLWTAPSTRHVSAMDVGAARQIRTTGLDIAKSVFQVQGVNAASNVVIRRQINRRYPAFEHTVPLSGAPCKCTPHIRGGGA